MALSPDPKPLHPGSSAGLQQWEQVAAASDLTRPCDLWYGVGSHFIVLLRSTAYGIVNGELKQDVTQCGTTSI